MALLTPTGLRARAAQLLAPVAANDPQVLNAPVDAVEPPCLIVAWDDPWLTIDTSCLWYAQLAVICVAGRVEPDAGVQMLENLAAHVITRLAADSGYAWPPALSQAPRLLEIAGIPLLGARLGYRAPVIITAPTFTSLERSAA